MPELEFGKDLFGEEIVDFGELRGRFVEPPFSILDTKTGQWQDKKRKWLRLGIKSEIGRSTGLTFGSGLGVKNDDGEEITTSIFDPFLCEILYRWFCPKSGKILDPFCGGSVRGIVANKLGFKYYGIDLRKEQIDSNIEQGRNILGDMSPHYICGDSEYALKNAPTNFDFIFSCPPYHDLEIYSNNPDDLSNMSWDKFLIKYEAIIKNSIDKLNYNRFACFVVGDLRDKKGYYKLFPQKTCDIFNRQGCMFYNEIILANSVGSASMRASKQFTASRKVAKIHQNILVFFKGDIGEIREIFNDV